MKRKGRYLFFDLECADGYHICSFGYAIISEDLKVLGKHDIIINPESKFVLSPKGKRPKVELAYAEEEFYKQDNFSAFYEEIKKLLTQEKYILIGHAIQSDFHFLKYACSRYKLPLFDLEGYDTQKIFKEISNSPHVESLEKIMNHLEIDTNKITFHRSCDDALATFYVARAMCEREGLTLTELLENHPNCKCTSKQLFENSGQKAIARKKYQPKRNKLK